MRMVLELYPVIAVEEVWFEGMLENDFEGR